MNATDTARRYLRRLPAWSAVPIGIGLFALLTVLAAVVASPAPDVYAQCLKKCEPRFSRVAPSTTGTEFFTPLEAAVRA